MLYTTQCEIFTNTFFTPLSKAMFFLLLQQIAHKCNNRALNTSSVRFSSAKYGGKMINKSPCSINSTLYSYAFSAWMWIVQLSTTKISLCYKSPSPLASATNSPNKILLPTSSTTLVHKCASLFCENITVFWNL